MVYFDNKYIELYMEPQESIFYYQLKIEDKYFKHMCVRNGNNIYTPYGYGGYQTNIKDPKTFYQALMQYEDYCRSMDVELETIKWHPYNTVVKQCLFDTIKSDRKLVCVDLTMTKEQRWDTYAANTRNILRKDGYTVERTDDIDTFIKMYENTMDRHKTSKFYYFKRDYYEKLMAIDGVEMYSVFHDCKLLTMGIFFLSSETASYHLSGSNLKYRNLNGNYYLLETLFDIAQSRGKTNFLLGGGTTNERFDSLLLFKQKFSKNTRDYYKTEMRFV